jgi:integrase
MKRLDGKEGDVSGGSKSLALATLAVLLRHAVKMEALSAVPTLAKEDKPKGDSSRKQRRILSREEENAIFETLDLDTCSWALPIAEVALGQALRLGESVALDWSDVDFAAGTLTVARTMAKDGRSTGTPKGGKEATITLTQRTRKVLLEAWMAAGRPDEGLVFPNAYGEHRTPQATARAFMRAVTEAGLAGTGISYHSLRHTAVSRLANDPKIPLVAVRDFARHSSLMVTEQYMHPVVNTEVSDAMEVAI